ncbi:MAG TPA: FkbM family methyltransferase [Moraxellaceae bacterium]|nr:FkbM family methyltransferase [Moraxellaceae bacterium]
MTSPLTLTLVDGTRVVTPDNLNLITPYVLQEQEDWFEDEIKFLRRLLQPGQKIIDIGANYGVYTLSMARSVGAGGHVWCFEPASGTANYLAQGIAANGYRHVTLEKSALSSQPGTARLSLNDNAELNEIIRNGMSPGASEEVPLTTLDHCLEQFGWSDIDFVKIDAEGEEANILKGGNRFFTRLSPLVEYEVKAGTDWHLALVEQFSALGYRSYRLVPGLDLLVPFGRNEVPDGYLLNLFSCKEDCARRLAARGLLADPALEPGAGQVDLAALANQPNHQWQAHLASHQYSQLLLPHWVQTMQQASSAPVGIILAQHAIAHDATLPPIVRFAALKSALDKARTLISTEAGFLRLSTFARLALEFGARSQALQALKFLADTITQQGSLNPAEPFLTPDPAFERISPGANLGNWVLAAVVTEIERKSAFSSFFTGPDAKPRLETLEGLQFAIPEIQRRLALVRRRFG